MTLEELFEKYGSDKGSHGYQQVYEPLFAGRRESVNRVLEVGIGTLVEGVPSTMNGFSPPHYRPGASLRAWRDWFPNAQIWGLDTQPDTMIEGEDRITTKLCNSIKADQVEAALGPVGMWFDLIVDDGSHQPGHQLCTLRNLWPRVAVGGVYVIEDVTQSAMSYMEPVITGVVGWRQWLGATRTKSRCGPGWIMVAIPEAL